MNNMKKKEYEKKAGICDVMQDALVKILGDGGSLYQTLIKNYFLFIKAITKIIAQLIHPLSFFANITLFKEKHQIFTKMLGFNKMTKVVLEISCSPV